MYGACHGAFVHNDSVVVNKSEKQQFLELSCLLSGNGHETWALESMSLLVIVDCTKFDVCRCRVRK